jgi:SAM-dependent methyltransferase
MSERPPGELRAARAGRGRTAARRWRSWLAAWAIPDPILAAAPESPWTFPTELFASRADAAAASPTLSNLTALEALPDDGTVLDVGCGAGAASLPLAHRARHLVGVDTSQDMLAAFETRARNAGVTFTALQGAWPDCAERIEMSDVAVCHHVAYNAPDLAGFALALTDHARSRVVMEMTLRHPQADLNDLWLRFHGLTRPEGPTAGDAEQVLREAGLRPARETWTPPGRGGFARSEALVAWTRRRLCLSGDRDVEIRDAMADRIVERDGLFGFAPRPVVTFWWNGRG